MPTVSSVLEDLEGKVSGLAARLGEATALDALATVAREYRDEVQRAADALPGLPAGSKDLLALTAKLLDAFPGAMVGAVDRTEDRTAAVALSKLHCDHPTSAVLDHVINAVSATLGLVRNLVVGLVLHVLPENTLDRFKTPAWTANLSVLTV